MGYSFPVQQYLSRLAYIPVADTCSRTICSRSTELNCGLCCNKAERILEFLQESP